MDEELAAASHFAKNTTGDLINSSLFVKNGVLYSFGEHWPIAVRQGDEVVINATRRGMRSTIHVGQATKALTQEGVKFIMSTMEEVKKIIAENNDG